MDTPSTPHEALFTYSEAFLGRKGMGPNTFIFAMIPGSSDFVIFYTRPSSQHLRTVWRQETVDHEQSEAILRVFAELRIPLNPEVRSWNSMHFERRLVVFRLGARITLDWDSQNSAMGDALLPLINLIAPIAERLRNELSQSNLITGEDDQL
jgi:hypothetical protein